MPTIPFDAEAGIEIIRRIQAGELEVVGLQVREVARKTIRFILRGAENLPLDPVRLGNMPPLEPLRAVMSVTQLVNLVGVAQNVMLARTLKQVEAKLNQIDNRLNAMSTSLAEMNFKLDVVVNNLNTAPISRLRAAQSMAKTARRLGETGQLIAAAKDAECAARDLLARATYLARSKQNDMPTVLLMPGELAGLVDAAGETMAIAAAMQLALGSRTLAADLLHHVADTVGTMRSHLSESVIDPNLGEYRHRVALANDAAVLDAAASLRNTQHWTRSRAVCISAGLIEPGQGEEFEAIPPGIGLAFESV